ncbi:hypothetical protein ACNI3T_03545 [Christiangramia sp. ASW11-125]|uniref:hypothetical protein n=1 Tax=Christiangramia sp. ASW11-125 TaxID=3400701 RepID=UPI003AAE8CB8
MKILHLHIVCILLLISNTLSSQEIVIDLQNPQRLSEKVFVHYNSSMLIPGERLYYKVYNFNPNSNEQSEISRIVHVMLISENGERAFTHVLDLKDGVAYSDYLVPSSLATGNYSLMAYTNWMLNYKTPAFFEEDIVVLNPYSPGWENKLKEIKYNRSKDSVANNKVLSSSINFDKNTYGKREKVLIELNLPDSISYSNLSLSVNKFEQVSVSGPGKLTESNKSSSGEFNLKHYPEYRGRHFTGSIIDSVGQKIPGKKTLFFNPASNSSKVRIFETKQDGSFDIQISDIIDYKEFELFTIEDENNVVVLDSIGPDFQNTYKSLAEGLSVENLGDFKKKVIHFQIEESYKIVKSDSVMEYKGKEDFYGSLAQEYILDDYTRFSTMEETLTEIITGVRFVNGGVGKQIRVLNSGNTNTIGGIPLILLDGKMVKNHQTIYDLNPATVYSMDVVRDKYYFGPEFYQGILSIRSKPDFTGNLPSNRFQISPAESKKEYYFAKYEERGQLKTNDRVPDYRHQLYWEPDLKSSSVKFYTSDVEGIFEVRIEGFYNNKPVSISKRFSVQ